MKLDKEIREMGASRSPVDPCVYEWNHPVHGRVFILVYDDDLIVAGKSLTGDKAIKSAVSGKFYVRDMAEVKDFIGTKVIRDRNASTITLSNPGDTTALLEAFGIEMASPKKNPMASGVKLAKTGKDLLPEGSRHAALVGSLLYVPTMTRPEIFCSRRAVPLHVLPRASENAHGQGCAAQRSRNNTSRGGVP